MRCFALVQLDSEAGRTLSARARPGEEASWVHRCQLAHGHDGDHHRVDATTGCTLDWDDSSIAPRITPPQSADAVVPDTGAPPTVDQDTTSLAAPAPRVINGAEHATAQVAVRTVRPGRTEAESLDAIASALERICDVFHLLVDDPDAVTKGWRHRTDSMDADRGGHSR